LAAFGFGLGRDTYFRSIWRTIKNSWF